MTSKSFDTQLVRAVFVVLVALLTLGVLPGVNASAQTSPTTPSAETIYRCGNTYTNQPSAAQQATCKKLDIRNITTIPGTKPRASGAASSSARTPTSTSSGQTRQRVDAATQRQRDANARTILQTELQKAQARLSAAQAAYNNGEPAKQGPEFRNHALYLERVKTLETAVARAQSDVDGLQRELARLPAASSAAAGSD